MPRRIGQGLSTLLASMALSISRAVSTAFAASRGSSIGAPKMASKPLPQKLVHYAVVPVDGVDQDFKNGVEALDDLGRRSTARGGGEAADVDEHDANPPYLAKLGCADREQLLDHPAARHVDRRGWSLRRGPTP